MENQERKDSVLQVFEPLWEVLGASRVVQGANNPPVYTGDAGLVPGVRRSPGGGSGNCSSNLAWKTPWTEEPGGLQSVGSQTVGHG